MFPLEKHSELQPLLRRPILKDVCGSARNSEWIPLWPAPVSSSSIYICCFYFICPAVQVFILSIMFCFVWDKDFSLNFFLFFFLTLQYCIGLAIYQNESATGIHVFLILNPPPSPYHPSRLSQCTSPKHPVSCIDPGLATHFIYGIIHVSMPFSQIIPPSPSPTESKNHTGLLLPTF